MGVCRARVAASYQFADLALQVLDAVELPLAAALGGDAVLAATANVVDELQLLRAQLVHLDEDLEVVARQVGDLVHGEGQLHLQPAAGTHASSQQVPSRSPFKDGALIFLASNKHCTHTYMSA